MKSYIQYVVLTSIFAYSSTQCMEQEQYHEQEPSETVQYPVVEIKEEVNLDKYMGRALPSTHTEQKIEQPSRKNSNTESLEKPVTPLNESETIEERKYWPTKKTKTTNTTTWSPVSWVTNVGKELYKKVVSHDIIWQPLLEGRLEKEFGIDGNENEMELLCKKMSMESEIGRLIREKILSDDSDDLTMLIGKCTEYNYPIGTTAKQLVEAYSYQLEVQKGKESKKINSMQEKIKQLKK